WSIPLAWIISASSCVRSQADCLRLGGLNIHATIGSRRRAGLRAPHRATIGAEETDDHRSEDRAHGAIPSPASRARQPLRLRPRSVDAVLPCGVRAGGSAP